MWSLPVFEIKDATFGRLGRGRGPAGPAAGADRVGEIDRGSADAAGGRGGGGADPGGPAAADRGPDAGRVSWRGGTGARLGEEVGYAVRFDTRYTDAKTRIVYLTDGVLQRWMQDEPGTAGGGGGPVRRVSRAAAGVGPRPGAGPGPAGGRAAGPEGDGDVGDPGDGRAGGTTWRPASCWRRGGGCIRWRSSTGPTPPPRRGRSGAMEAVPVWERVGGACREAWRGSGVPEGGAARPGVPAGGLRDPEVAGVAGERGVGARVGGEAALQRAGAGAAVGGGGAGREAADHPGDERGGDLDHDRRDPGGGGSGTGADGGV